MSVNRAITSKEQRVIFLILFGILLCLFILDIFLGSLNIKPVDVLKAIFSGAPSDSAVIILKFRIPKALTALIVGIALSLSGLLMQTVFRNPLAGPDVMGISSGASLGVAIVVLGFSGSISHENLSPFSNWILVFASWAGAGIIMFLIIALSTRVRDIMTILILGIMLSSGISAIVTILQYFSHETMLKAYIIWTMGSLGNLGSEQLRVLIISVAIGFIMSLFAIKVLNALLIGESYAASLGVNVLWSRILIFTSASILTGSVTAFCGPVGFIGIAVPHITRILFRTSEHRILIPSTILAGGVAMLLSDIVSQLPGSDVILPINSVTSLLGIPIVIWIIMRNKNYSRVF
jgi:iron complex transport system permease protein